MKRLIFKRIRSTVVTVAMFAFMCFCINTMAGQYSYGNFIIDCNISGTRYKGSGSTSGAMTGYQNNVLITIYDSSGTSLGNQSCCAENYYIASASVSNLGGNIRRVYTLHSLAQNYQQVYPQPQQVKLNIYP